MARPLKGDEPLTEIVKFRLTRSELRVLRKMCAAEQISPLLRRLLREEAARQGIR